MASRNIRNPSWLPDFVSSFRVLLYWTLPPKTRRFQFAILRKWGGGGNHSYFNVFGTSHDLTFNFICRRNKFEITWCTHGPGMILNTSRITRDSPYIHHMCEYWKKFANSKIWKPLALNLIEQFRRGISRYLCACSSPLCFDVVLFCVVFSIFSSLRYISYSKYKKRAHILNTQEKLC